MPGKVKCTYEDCFKHFNDETAMKKHKAKDSAHDYYCKRCDVDCKDDSALMYHQITGDRHVACPICGREFRSESGRDRHVDIDHVPQQNITCMGCRSRFGKASSLMAHIERNECPVIRREDFQLQKAENAIAQDALTSILDPLAGATILTNVPAYTLVNDATDLLDDDRASTIKDLPDQSQHGKEALPNNSYVNALNGPMSNLSVSVFPPLGPQSRVSLAPDPNRPAILTRPVLRPLQSYQEGGEQDPKLSNVWTNQKNSSRLFKPGSDGRNKPPTTAQYPTTDLANPNSVNLLDYFNEDDEIHGDTTGAEGHPSKLNALKSTTASSIQGNASDTDDNRSTSTIVPPSTRAQNQDPNHPRAQITLQANNDRTPLLLHRFWDPVLQHYICPSSHCGMQLASPAAFNAHLLSPIHTTATVSCPSCYKTFKSTTALIAHCESGSRKCRVRETTDFDRIIRNATAGLVAVDGETEDGGVRFVGRALGKGNGGVVEERSFREFRN